MLDLIGSIFVGLYGGTILMLVLQRSADVRAFSATVAFVVMWLGAQIIIGIKAEESGIAVQPNLLMFALSITLLTTAWVFVPAFRRAAAATRLESLVGLHAWRLGGFFFLLLYASNRLPSPFAPVAAIGDIITGAVAATVAIALAINRWPTLQTIFAWNVFGLIDLIVAVILALLATPGAPFQIFTDVPTRSAFTQLPWILVPSVIVPALFFSHLAIFLNLKSESHELLRWQSKDVRA